MNRRRFALGAALPALLVSTFVTGLYATPAASAAVGDRTVVETIAPGNGGALTRTVTDGPASAGFLMSNGVLALGTWQIDLAGTTVPSPGTYSLGTSSTANHLVGVCNSVREGQLQIADVVYDGTSVTRLVASFGVRCSPPSSTVSTWVSATIEIGGTQTVPVVRPLPVVAPTTAAGTASTVTTTLRNTGEASTGVLGAAALDSAWSSAADFSVQQDGCVGHVLAPGEDCTVTVGFLRPTGGTSVAWVKVPDAASPGAVVVAPVSGSAIAPPGPPYAKAFPALGGEGVLFGRGTGFAPTGYRVERRVGDAWVDASGLIDATTLTWVDHTLLPGESAVYRVRAFNLGGESTPSPDVVTTRPTEDPVVGAVSAYSVDADYADRRADVQGVDTAVTDGVVESLGRRLDDGTIFARHLTAPGQPSIGLPYLIVTPGSYPIGPAVAPEDNLSVPLVSTGWCGQPTGTLTVDEVAYTSTLELAVLTARYELACSDGLPFYGELRLNSTAPLSAAGITPVRSDAGPVPVGESSSPTRVEVVNRGTGELVLGDPQLSGAASDDWRVVGSDCPPTLASGGRCGIDLAVTPTRGGQRPVVLAVPDGTRRGVHHAVLTATGTSVPQPPVAVAALAVPQGGVDLSWSAPDDYGGSAITGYVVRRVFGDQQQTSAVTQNWWSDTDVPSGASYEVAAVNAIGQGLWSAPVTMQEVPDHLFVTTASAYGEPLRPAFLAVPGGTHPVPAAVRPGLNQTVWGAATSPDGREIVISRNADVGSTGWVVVRERVDGTGTPLVLLRSTGRPMKPAWSSDGTLVAVTTMSADFNQPTLHVIDATTGTLVFERDWLKNPSWHPDSRSLFVVDDSVQARPLVRIDGRTGTRLSTFTGLDNASALSTSPDGRWLAALRYTDRFVISLLPLGGGTVREVPESGGARDISWSPDSRTLVSAQDPWMGQMGFAVSTVAESGEASSPSYLPMRPSVVVGNSVVWVGRSVRIAPSLNVLGPTSTFAIDRSALPSGTTLACSLDSAPYASCSDSYRPISASGTHLLRVRATEPSGRVSIASRTFTLDVTAPSVRLTGPTALATTSTSALVSYSGSDTAGVASYDIRYRRATFGGNFGGFTTAVSRTRATSARVTLAPGYQYCFSIRGRDALGNVSAWTSERCIAKVLDDRSLAPGSSAWVRASGTPYYGGTVTQTSTYGASLTRSGVKARQVLVLATTCSACGSVTVYVGSTKVGTLSLSTSTTRNRVLLATNLRAAAAGTLKLVTTSANGRAVRIDAFAIRSW